MHHYSYVKVYVPNTSAVRDVGMATFFPIDITFPKVNLEDYLR